MGNTLENYEAIRDGHEAMCRYCHCGLNCENYDCRVNVLYSQAVVDSYTVIRDAVVDYLIHEAPYSDVVEFLAYDPKTSGDELVREIIDTSFGTPADDMARFYDAKIGLKHEK